MTGPILTPGERARDEARRAIDATILAMARTAGTEIRERRPFGPGSLLTVHDPEPLAAIRFALILKDAATVKVRAYIQQARSEGVTWAQVGEALNLRPAAEESGASVAEAAFDYAAGAGHATAFQRLSFSWTCSSCKAFITERGPDLGGHPVDGEPGHAEDCERFAALVAEYEARWADE